MAAAHAILPSMSTPISVSNNPAASAHPSASSPKSTAPKHAHHQFTPQPFRNARLMLTPSMCQMSSTHPQSTHHQSISLLLKSASSTLLKALIFPQTSRTPQSPTPQLSTDLNHQHSQEISSQDNSPSASNTPAEETSPWNHAKSMSSGTTSSCQQSSPLTTRFVLKS